MFRSLTTHALPRPLAIFIVALMALYLMPLNALPADAAVASFEIDGNQVSNGGQDWASLTPGSMPDAGGKTNRVLSTFVDNVSAQGADTTTFGSNNKEDGVGGQGEWPNWVPTNGGQATGKSDFGRLASYSYVENNHVFLVLGFDRGSNVNGSATATYYFELNQANQGGTNPNPKRTQGDIRIKLDDQGSGSFVASVQMWSGTTWVAAPNAGDYAIASNSSGPISPLASWWTPSLNVHNGSIDKEGFIETSLDLSSFGVVLGCPSTGFNTLNGRSTTGNSDKNLVDYFAPQTINVPADCASLFIRKFKGDGTTALGGATFEITPNPLPNGTPGANLSSLIIFDDSDATTDVEPGTNYDDPDADAGEISLPAVKAGIEYTVTEVAAPDGWIKDSSAVKVTPVPFGTSQSASNTATFTNHRGSVTFSKDYEGQDPAVGASFTLTRDNDDADALYNNGTVTVTDNGQNDSDPAIGVIKVDPLDAGSWKLIEDVGGAPSGWLRDNTEITFTVPDAMGRRDVVLQSPTLSDLRRTYPLTVRKVAEADNTVRVNGAVFDLYQETNSQTGLQLAGDTKVGTCTTAGNGQCSVTGLAWGESYYWYEVSVPSPYNLPSDRVVGPINLHADGSPGPEGTAVFQDPQSKIVTQATNASLPNATISDTAKLTGVNNDATGLVTFDLFYTGRTTEPTASSCTAANKVGETIVGTPAVHGNGQSYATGPIAVTKAGYYTWVAHYSGDTNGNRAADSPCDDTNETSYVEPLTPGIATVAQALDRQLPDTKLYDTAKVSPVTGTLDTTVANVDFYLYGPGDTTCSGATVFESLDQPVTVLADSDGGFYAEATSTIYEATTPGTYRWVAKFQGDENNTNVDGTCNADNEDTYVLKAVPSITTDAGADKTLGVNGVSLQDSATLAGGTTVPAITGSIVFRLYYSATAPLAANDCTADSFVAGSESTVTVNGNKAYSSTPVNVTNAGWYNWTANYEPGADANNADIPPHGCGLDAETVNVGKAQPAISTAATSASLPNGSITDTATVSGLAGKTPSGTVTFTLYGPSASPVCLGAGIFTSVRPLETVAAGEASVTSAAYQPTEAGKYWWIASYAGDANNGPVAGACGATGETSTVTPATPAIDTVASDANLPGGTIQDVAKVTGLAATASGTVTFSLYGPSASAVCTGQAVFVDHESFSTLTGKASVTSSTFSPATAGNYYWIASYGGDLNNAPVTGACGDTGETSTVHPATPTISTTASESAVLPLGTLSDAATLHGVTDDAEGTVTFRLYGPDSTPGDPTCSPGTLAYTSPAVAISHFGSGVATASSASFTPTVTGTYFWVASYSGDGVNNLAVTGTCGDQGETSTVTKAKPTITTQVPAARERLAPTATLTDTATLAGATDDPKATGTITFTLYGPFDNEPGVNSCEESSALGTLTAPVSGSGSYSPTTPGAGITVHEAGFYTWVAAYSGDDNNAPVTHDCGLASETVDVLPTEGTITTDAVDRVKLSSGTTTITDQATLAGVTVNPAATGTIEFKVYGPFATALGAASCTDPTLLATVPATRAVDGPATYTSEAVQVKRAGYYVWVATYSGDANNQSATHPCGQTQETTTVDAATPSLTTQVAAASVALPNASLVDTATLSAATTDPKATGTITFDLFGPFPAAPNSASCAGAEPLATVTAAVTNGNGSYASPGVVVDTAGYYTWVATYSGDDNNESATHACAQESETVLVTQARTSVATVATSAAIIKSGDSISDGATVTGLAAGATGTVAFALYGPDDATCSGAAVFSSTVALTVVEGENGTATGSATSGSFTPTAVGTYRWVASYSGDANNAVSAGACNDPNEQSVVRGGDIPNLDKTADPASGSAVAPRSTINYSVRVFNTGDVAITDADVVDVLPAHVTVKPGSISDGGVLSADKSTITWQVTLAPASDSSTDDEKTLTYAVTVDADAPQGSVLVNTARFLGLQDTTTHTVPTGALALVKEVSPVEGNGVVVQVGDTLTYTLTANATGALDQPNVVVTDYLPGSDPARPSSGATSYVAGSAGCIGAGPCTVTGPDAKGLITWSLGDMAAGTSRKVTFKVTIDAVTGNTAPDDILNAGTVSSDLTPPTPSNEVVTPLTAVLGVKIPNTPVGVLPHTGAPFPIGATLGAAIAMLSLGVLLVAASRQRRWTLRR